MQNKGADTSYHQMSGVEQEANGGNADETRRSTVVEGQGETANGTSQGTLEVGTHSCSSCVCSISRLVLRCFLYSSLFIFILLAFIVPAILHAQPELANHIVYLNAFKIPYHVNLSDPASVGLHYSRNFYHHVEEDISVGVWHVLPRSLERQDVKAEDFEGFLSAGPAIILYCHGNTGNRGIDHRIDMYKVLASQDFHILALDYRGFGDSTGSPTSENGVVTDVVKLYLWLREKAGPDIPIYLWGHSLGTGISSKAARFLTEQQKEYPRALILESPFNNILDAAMAHPFSRLVGMFWWFDDVFLTALHNNGIFLQNDEHICHIDLPVLILHAEDDYVVPFSLGKKLYESSKKRPESFPPVVFHSFDAERGFVHKWICTAPELPDIVHKFIAETKQGKPKV